MPNHVTSLLTIKGKAKDIGLITKTIGTLVKEEGSDSYFLFPDFNKVIEMPKELNISSGSDGDTGYSVIKRKNLSRYCDLKFAQSSYDRKTVEEKIKCIELGLQYVKNEQNYGFKNWYDWRVANWGTKWNAYGCEKISENIFKFQTAWSAPVKVFEKIALMFPLAKIVIKYADEDTGSNCGVITIANGNYEIVCPEDSSKEAYELAFEVNPSDKEYYKLIGGSYEYVEE